MLGRGRYSQHKKLNTEPEKDDLFDDRDVDDNSVVDDDVRDDEVHRVTYLGQEHIPNLCEEDYPVIVKKMYGQKFSFLNALVQSKKLNLHINESGINVTTPQASSKNFADHGKVFMSYKLPNLAYLSTDNQRAKVLAVVCRDGRGDAATLSVFVCQDEEDPIRIMDDCALRICKENNIRKIVDVKRTIHPSALSIVYESFAANQTISSPVTTQIAAPILASPNQGFGDFQTKPLPSPENKGNKELGQRQSLTKDVDLEDEFSQLAMKRNVNLPHHLQDKTVESAFLIQEADTTKMKSTESFTEAAPSESSNSSFFNTNFFSSYSRVSTGHS